MGHKTRNHDDARNDIDRAGLTSHTCQKCRGTFWRSKIQPWAEGEICFDCLTTSITGFPFVKGIAWSDRFEFAVYAATHTGDYKWAVKLPGWEGPIWFTRQEFEDERYLSC